MATDGTGKWRMLGVLALFAAFLGAFFGWMSGEAYTETYPRPFNSSRWIAAGKEGEARCGMIVDLQYRTGVVGKSRADLSRLLGEPEVESKDLSSSYWTLCPSFTDVWILEVRWRDGRAESAVVRDT